MKIKTLLTLIIISCTILFFSFSKNMSGIGKFNHFDAKNTSSAPNGKTGAPGENNCTQCHSGTSATMNSSNINLQFSGANNKYVPGTNYSITLSITDTISSRNGFQMVALKNSDSSNVGDFVVTDAINTQKVDGGSRDYMTHTSTGTQGSSWSFDWTAPTTGQGAITFYVATNLSNNNGNTSGDLVHLRELVVQEDGVDNITDYLAELNNSLKLINSNNIIATRLSVKEVGTVLIDVVSLRGQVIYTNQEQLTKGQNTLTPIDFNQFSRGIYIINYTIGTHHISRKVMI